MPIPPSISPTASPSMRLSASPSGNSDPTSQTSLQFVTLTMHLIEHLEPRIAPAVLINPTTVKFIDVDGDNVTVHISKPLFTEANFKTALSFVPSADVTGAEIPEYLSRFDVKQFG